MPHDAVRITLGFAVVDARRQFLRRESAEHDRVNGTEPRAREHGEHGLRNAWHVDEDAVPLADALGAQRPGKPGYLVQQLVVGERADRAGDGAVEDERRLLAASARDVAVYGVVAGVQDAAGEPADRTADASHPARGPSGGTT